MALALTLLAAGCATGPIGSTAPSTASSTAPSTAPSPARPASAPPSAAPSAWADSAQADAACVVPARFRGVEVERLDVKGKFVALTFDAGANGDAVRPILRTLAARGVPGTFFVTGTFAKTYPVKARRIAGKHLVGNHSMTHPDFTTLTDRQVRRQVRRAETLILDRAGEDPRRFFRFPFGARDQQAIDVLNELCYVPFRWTVDTLGWKGTSGGMTAAKVVDRVVDAVEPGAIVLMHVGSNPDDGTTLDSDALPVLIRKLRALGYDFVRLSRVLRPAP